MVRLASAVEELTSAAIQSYLRTFIPAYKDSRVMGNLAVDVIVSNRCHLAVNLVETAKVEPMKMMLLSGLWPECVLIFWEKSRAIGTASCT